MKTKLVPGIFIPYILVDLSSSEFDAIENHVENLLANNKLRLQKFLENCGGYVLQDACMVCDEVVYLGLFFKPEQPHQMTYGQVWNIVKTNAGIDALREKGYTVPLNSVAAAGTGLVTKSLVACGGKFTVNQAAEILRRFHSQCGLPADLVLTWDGDGYELHGTSPLQDEGNPALAWQNYMSRAFKAVLPQATPMFYQTWSTNDELTKRLTGRGRTVSAEREAEYARYSKRKD